MATPETLSTIASATTVAVNTLFIECLLSR
jgi:hypothetical protein